MGNLVFQATLGGQVNLVGPNTASTFNLNVPAVSSTIATLTGTETFTNKTLTTPVISSLSSASATALTLQSAGTTAITVDTSQNVGIGTTSPAFTSSNRHVLVTDGTTDSIVGVMAGGVAQAYLQGTSSATNLFTANTNPLTLGTNNVERMRIDSSGNVGIGVTPSTMTQKTIELGASGNVITTNGSNDIQIAAGGYYNATWKYAVTGSAVSNYYQDNGIHVWRYAASGTTGNTITWSEAARIDTSGNLLVGTTSTITVAGLGSTNAFKSSTSGSTVLTLQNTNATDAKGLVINYTTDFNSAGQQVIFFYAGSTTRFVVNSNGNVANTNNSYGAISDQKLKENIVDATPKLDNLCRVKVRNFNLIGETTKQIGVVAQELEQVFPSMIEESPDRDGEGNELGTTSKSVKYSVFVPMLVKAIQELKAINDTQAETINALTARVVALEAK